MTRYTITHDPSLSRWTDNPYTVEAGPRYIGNAVTLRGARRIVRKQQRRDAKNARLNRTTRIVWSSDDDPAVD
jgi:hypothetical protein